MPGSGGGRATRIRVETFLPLGVFERVRARIGTARGGPTVRTFAVVDLTDVGVQEDFFCFHQASEFLGTRLWVQIGVEAFSEDREGRLYLGRRGGGGKVEDGVVVDCGVPFWERHWGRREGW